MENFTFTKHILGIKGGITSIKEALEACLGKKLKQEYVDEAMKAVKLDISKATVTSVSTSDSPSHVYAKDERSNVSSEEQDFDYGPIKLTFSKSEEIWKEKTSGWSVSGTLGVEYEGATASTTAVYRRGKAEKSIKRDLFTVEIPFSKKIKIMPHTTVTVVVEEEELVYTISVKGLLLEFPSDAELKTAWLKKKLIAKILKDCIKRPSDDGKIIAEIDGKVEIMDVKRSVKEYQTTH